MQFDHVIPGPDRDERRARRQRAKPPVARALPGRGSSGWNAPGRTRREISAGRSRAGALSHRAGRHPRRAAARGRDAIREHGTTGRASASADSRSARRRPHMYDMLEVVDEVLPQDRPRYLMGVGFPEDLVEGMRRGVDLFDCVAPTRMGRNGAAVHARRPAQHQARRVPHRSAPARPRVRLRGCTRFTRAYIRHLFVSRRDTRAAPALPAQCTFPAVARCVRRATRYSAWQISTSWSARLARSVITRRTAPVRMKHSGILSAHPALQIGGRQSKYSLRFHVQVVASSAIFYFVLIRPQQKQRKKHEERAAQPQEGR